MSDTLTRVISGGQTGADIGGWRAAKDSGLLTGGWMPVGYMTEDGPKPEYANIYGAIELSGDWLEPPSLGEQYKIRRRYNVEWADKVILFGDVKTAGSRGLFNDCRDLKKPPFVVRPGMTRPRDVREWLAADGGCFTLMVAGNRGSTDPEIEGRVERFLKAVFQG